MAPVTRYHQRSSQHEALSLIRQSLGLPSLSSSDETYNVKDAIIISIDFENVEKLIIDPYEPYLKAQMGVCILDTQKIGTSTTDKILKTVCSYPCFELVFPSLCILPRKFQSLNSLLFLSVFHSANLLQYNFTTGAWRDRDEDFLFGQSQQTTVRELIPELNKLIDRTRNIILLAHDCTSELAILKKLGFDFKTGITAILDTQQLMTKVFKNSHEFRSLEALLNKLGIQHKELHVGGNDANFTLKALMLLVVKSFNLDSKSDSMDKQVQERLCKMAKIGESPLPERRACPANGSRSSLTPLPQQDATTIHHHKQKLLKQLERLRKSQHIQQPYYHAPVQCYPMHYPRGYCGMVR